MSASAPPRPAIDDAAKDAIDDAGPLKAGAGVEIRPVETARDRRAFIRLVHDIYRDDPNYVAPLEFEIGPRIDPEKNPGLKNAPHRLWIAYRNGAPAGRIAAIVNKAHLDTHRDGAGHFGFIEMIDDEAVANALLATASDWLKRQGMSKIAGPFSFSVNEECGLLVDGFDTPPYVMMPHGRPYYAGHLERLGFRKAMDAYALSYLPRRQFIPEKRQRFVDKVLSKSNITIRNIDFAKFNTEIRLVIDIYNDAWSDNWGYVPMSDEQIAHMAKELRPIIERHNVVFCELDGEPVAFGLVLPDVNAAIRGFNGKLAPFNWATFLWRLKVKGVGRSRMPLMGVRKRLQGKPVGAAFAYKIIDLVNSANMDHGCKHAELSWILENNTAMLTMLTDIGGEIYKTYRFYEKAL